MNPDSSGKMNKLKQVCNRIILEHPQAICMALLELDCGCINVCGVSVTGKSVGRMEAFSSIPKEKSGRSPICIRCAGAGAPMMERITHRALIWPGADNEMPDLELRNLIGREVFGPDYTEPG